MGLSSPYATSEGWLTCKYHLYYDLTLVCWLEGSLSRTGPSRAPTSSLIMSSTLERRAKSTHQATFDKINESRKEDRQVAAF